MNTKNHSVGRCPICGQGDVGNSKLIVSGKDIGNQNLANTLNSKGNLADWGKYETQSIASPSGSYKVHFYFNSVTKETYYDMDYKSVYNHQGKWDLGLKPNFDFEPPRYK